MSYYLEAWRCAGTGPNFPVMRGSRVHPTRFWPGWSHGPSAYRKQRASLFPATTGVPFSLERKIHQCIASRRLIKKQTYNVGVPVLTFRNPFG